MASNLLQQKGETRYSQGGLTSHRWPVVEIMVESLLQYDEKHVVPTPLSGTRIGNKKVKLETSSPIIFSKNNYFC
jgi:hypothetical protein